MGHIAHLRKQFKSINTYDYIITLIRRRKKPFLTLWEFIGSSFEETWIPYTQGCFVPRLFEIGPVVLEKKIFKFCQCILLFRKYLLLEKGRGLHLIKLESPLPKDGLCQVWLKLAQWFWRRKFFIFINVFSLFPNYLPLEKGWALHLKKLECPSPKDDLCQVWLKLDQWFRIRRFFNLVNVFSLFSNYLPLEKGGVLHLNKL